MPPTETDLVGPVPPPDQAKVAPGVVEEAVIVIGLVVQVIVPGGAMLTLGVAIFCDTETEAVEVHLLAGSLTVTV